MNPRLPAVLDRLLPWTLPGALVLLAAVAWLQLDPDSPVLAAAVEGYPWVLHAVALILAWRFRRSRIAAAVVAVAGVQAAPTLLPDPTPGAFAEAAGIAFPPLFAVVALLRDRPIVSLRGALAPGLVLLALGAAAVVGLRWPGPLSALAERSVSLPGVEWAPTPSILSAAVGGAVVATVTLVRRGPVERGLLWSLAALVLALGSAPASLAFGVHLLASGLILCVAVVEGSYALAYHDELTGLPARRALNQELDRLGGRYTVAMVDVDHFKAVNDEHGHEVGDQVLKMVASRLRKAPGGARAFRYGGEEFTLLFPGKTPDEARPHLEAVREAVKGSTFTVRGPKRRKKGRKSRGKGSSRRRKKLSVTVSLGAAEPREADEAPRTVLERADEALYRAKEKGRNRVET
ncbi:MAG: diguanylate cyclase [Gemmatimonadetes bacterium]|nr:GGDEF domain-containing protein [Gemmatimonadota bacterium]NIR79295.1 GGDEF domain-containing protein [Gemmatimonadota bacterium]NIT87952.1 GGDEF domain-containing protein [Gemmatimonadota bacterium]NIU31803.1 GGDEF domain-containing protein [Gemmatimonadota bacterium]NIU36418.1 diguanylate cyclase [Gemmatimonadota bacterium]